MPIPDYQTVMLPLLEIAADGKEHAVRSAIEHLAKAFNLSESERKDLLPSGVDNIFDNRIGWARTYLKKAKLIDSPKRGYFQITDRGRTILSNKPAKIDVAFLRQFPEFLEFWNPKKVPGENSPKNIQEISAQTPEETLATGYLKLRKQLEADVLARVKTSAPEFFERLVVRLLTSIGY